MKIENDEDENLILVNTLRRDDSIVEPHVILEELKVLKENEIGEVRQIIIKCCMFNDFG